MIVSCRHSATTKAYDNGTSKDHGGNKINQSGSETTVLKVAIIVLVMLILVLFGIIFYIKRRRIIFYIERKRRRGNYCHLKFYFSSLRSIECLLRNINYALHLKNTGDNFTHTVLKYSRGFSQTKVEYSWIFVNYIDFLFK